MKYKLQERGILDTERGVFISFDTGNRDYREYLEWLTLGNIPDPEFTSAEAEANALAEKIQAVKNEGLSRIKVVMPAIDNFDTLELVRELWTSINPAARAATPTLQSLIDIYQAGRSAIIFLKGAAPSVVTTYDVVLDPNW